MGAVLTTVEAKMSAGEMDGAQCAASTVAVMGAIITAVVRGPTETTPLVEEIGESVRHRKSSNGWCWSVKSAGREPRDNGKLLQLGLEHLSWTLLSVSENISMVVLPKENRNAQVPPAGTVLSATVTGVRLKLGQGEVALIGTDK